MQDRRSAHPVLVLAKGGCHDQTAGIVDPAHQGQDRSKALEPVVARAIDLDEPAPVSVDKPSGAFSDEPASQSPGASLAQPEQGNCFVCGQDAGDPAGQRSSGSGPQLAAGLVSSMSASLSFEETDKITEQLAVPDSLSNDRRCQYPRLARFG